jgi:hypothetical protein
MKLSDFTAKNIKAYIQAHYRMLEEDLNRLPYHIKEQVIWRSKQAKECTENKKCVYCGCSTEDLELYYADLGCKKPENPCYPPMMSADDWEQYKFHNAV